MIKTRFQPLFLLNLIHLIYSISFTTNDSLNNVTLKVIYEDDDSFQITIKKANENKFEVPTDIMQSPTESESSPSSKGFVNNLTNPLNFRILNPNTGAPIFTFVSDEFKYEEFFIKFNYKLTTDKIFGYGERVHEFLLGDGNYTIWPNDTNTPYDDGTGGKNLYGIHPFILNKCKGNNSWIGILFVNTNAQELVIAKDQSGLVNLTHITIGGIIDLRIIRGSTPNEVVKKYHNKIGKPMLPPYWALGWHHSKWGYKTEGQLVDVVNGYINNNIPLDVIWSDIDYMENKVDFTVDELDFPNMKNRVMTWKENGIHYVPIIDLGLAENSTIANEAKELKCLIKSNYTKEFYTNQVWPGVSVFVDFTHPKGFELWKAGLNKLKDIIGDASGIWLDMNEPAVFDDDNVSTHPEKNKYASLPYIPGNKKINLNSHTMSVNALLYGDGNSDHSTIFNYKGINTFLQNEATNQFLASENKRVFILSRATMFGQGRIANHWLGDNESTDDSMKYSIPGIFNFQMFGFNLVGADICGFNGNTTDELCARWTNLGAFYPFSRNHNTLFGKSQEPWVIGPLTLNASKMAIRLRYSLIKYIYTQLFLSSREGGMTFKPIFFEFPDDEEAYLHIDEQFFLGPALLINPVLNSYSTKEINAYLPNANWNRFPDGENILDYSINGKGHYVSLSGSYDSIHVFMKGGSVVPCQDVLISTLNTKELRKNYMNLYINPDQNNSAFGKIIYDDGITLGTIKQFQYNEINIYYDFPDIIFNQVQYYNYTENDSILTTIKIMRYFGGAPKDIEVLFLDGTKLSVDRIIYDKLKPNRIILNLPQYTRIFDIKKITIITQ